MVEPPDMRVRRTRSSAIRALAFVAIACACSTASQTGTARSRAEVTVTQIAPAVSSEVMRGSTLDATVAYRIDGFQPGPDRYYLTIQFEKTGGGTFNHYRRFAEEPVLSRAEGTVHLTYAMAHVWDDQRLKKPIRVWFYVIERTAQHDSTVIGTAGPFDYAGR